MRKCPGGKCLGGTCPGGGGYVLEPTLMGEARAPTGEFLSFAMAAGSL